MKLLITGGAGFIGSNFIRYVLEKHKDWEVINLDKLGYGSNLANLKDIEDDPRYTFVKGDINDFELVSKLIKQVDAVVNFAAESVAENEFVAIHRHGRIRLVTFGELFEQLSKTNKVIKDGKHEIIDVSGKNIKVLSFYNGYGAWFPLKKVIRHYYKGKLLCLRQKWGEICVTPNHSVYDVFGNLVSAESNPELLAVRRINYYPHEHKFMNPVRAHAEGNGHLRVTLDKVYTGERLKALLRLLAAYISEGNATYNKANGSYTVVINNRDKEWLKSLAEDYKLISNGSYSITKRKDGVYQLELRSKEFYQMCIELCGKNAPEKKLPDFVYGLDREYQMLFWETLLKGDGMYRRWKRDKIAEYTTVSRRLAAGLGLLLALMGIDYTYYINKPKKGNYTSYTLRTRLFYNVSTGKREVIEIEYEGYVYDLEVERSHNFIAGVGNIVAHNTHVDRSISNPYAFIESNVLGVYTLLEAIRKVNPEVRFVHISSVTGDTPVLLRNKETGEIFLTRIDFLNEENYHLYEALTIDEDLKATFMPISGIVKHPADEIYEIEYEGGGKIKATGSHSVFVFTEDGIKEKYVTELEEGEYLVTLLTFNKNNFESNHVLRIRDYIDMKKIKTSRRIKKSLKIRERVLKILKDGPKTWKELTESLGKSISQSLKSMVEEGLIEVVNGRYRITEKGLTELSNGFEETAYVLYRRQLNIPHEIEEIEVTPELMWLFGLYLAEGHASNTEKESKRNLKKVTITTRDLESLKKAKKLLEKYFGYKKAVIRRKKHGDVYQLEFSGEILHSIFSEWGSTSENKRIPSWVWKLPRDHIAKMLEGYEGDAHIRKDGSRTFTSKNQTLIFSLIWLTRLKGINSRYVKRVCKNMKGKFQKREEYDLVMHDLVVSSENYEENKLVRTPHSKCIPLGVVKAQLPKNVIAKYNLKKNKLIGKEVAKRLIKGKNKYVDSDIGVAKVKKITKINEKVMVYDIVIEGNHKFFGGNVPILLHNTDEVYGDIIEGSFTEEDRLMPSSPYSASKAAGDMLVLGWARTYNLNASITRCTNNYGPYQFPEKLIPKTIIRAAMGLKVPIYGTGQNVRDWIYVEDHVRAVEAVLLKGEPREIYNISAGEEKTNLEVVKTILRLMGKDESLIEFVEDRPGHDLRYSLDSWKIMRDLKWKPKVSFEEGIKKTVEWYLNNEWWWRPLADERVLHPTPWKLKW